MIISSQANRWCDQGRQRFPADYRFTECQLWVFAMVGQEPDIPRAWQLLDEWETRAPQNRIEFERHKARMVLAMALARAGLGDSAAAVAEGARAGAELDPAREMMYYEVIVRSMIGDNDEALRLLSTYLASNPHLRESQADDDSWWFRDLRQDPRYGNIVGTGR